MQCPCAHISMPLYSAHKEATETPQPVCKSNKAGAFG